jgi:hypothetical protein
VVASAPTAASAAPPEDEIVHVLTVAHWKVRVDHTTRGGSPGHGVCITVKDAARPPQAAALLLGSLRVAGIDAYGDCDPALDVTSPDEFWLSVGGLPGPSRP